MRALLVLDPMLDPFQRGLFLRGTGAEEAPRGDEPPLYSAPAAIAASSILLEVLSSATAASSPTRCPTPPVGAALPGLLPAHRPAARVGRGRLSLVPAAFEQPRRHGTMSHNTAHRSARPTNANPVVTRRRRVTRRRATSSFPLYPARPGGTMCDTHCLLGAAADISEEGVLSAARSRSGLILSPSTKTPSPAALGAVSTRARAPIRTVRISGRCPRRHTSCIACTRPFRRCESRFGRRKTSTASVRAWHRTRCSSPTRGLPRRPRLVRSLAPGAR
jgi:hypothetical protein